MNREYEYVREALVALISGLITAGTSAVTVLQEHTMADITTGQWITIAIGGGLAALSGWKQLLSRQPKRYEGQDL